MKTPTMEELFETLPEIPDDFREFCMSMVDPTPIYYRRRGKYADCRCGKCNAVYVVEGKPVKDTKTRCPRCNTEGVYHWMSETREKYDFFTVLLLQKRTDNNLVVRYFSCRNVFHLGEKRKFTTTERNRILLNMGDFYKFNWQYTDEWSTQGNGITYEDLLYPGWEEEIKTSNFKYFKEGYGGLIEELKAYARNPGLEMMEKIGLTNLKRDLVLREGRSRNINRRGKNLKAQLRLKNKQRINELVRKNGGLRMLEILQLEEKQGIWMTEEQKRWVDVIYSQWKGKENMAYMLKFMTFQKLYNKCRKYALKGKARTNYEKGSTFSRYADYLRMREELGYDMTNEVFLFPKNLKEKHDEMVEEKNKRADELYIEKQEKAYGKIRERFKKLTKKYEYEEEGLRIRPAASATEIIEEGRTLHHCVGRDRYLKSHNDGKSFILFLRRKEDEPYYTIEIRENTIVQWYGANDKKPDKEVIGPWLERYVQHLKGETA